VKSSDQAGEPLDLNVEVANQACTIAMADRVKLLMPDHAVDKFELYDLETDPAESRDLSAEQPEVFARLRTALVAWNASVAASIAGHDYPEGKVSATEPPSREWSTSPEYRPYMSELRKRPEFQNAKKGQ
jgi:hypothetical protein